METIDISGFGGGYEACCQRLLTNALVYLAGKGDAEGLKFKGYENVTGLCIPEGKLSEEMDRAVMEGEDDVTGAMHRGSISHAFWIVRNGYDAWWEEGRERDPERVYELEDERREAILDKWPCKPEAE